MAFRALNQLSSKYLKSYTARSASNKRPVSAIQPDQKNSNNELLGNNKIETNDVEVTKPASKNLNTTPVVKSKGKRRSRHVSDPAIKPDINLCERNCKSAGRRAETYEETQESIPLQRVIRSYSTGFDVKTSKSPSTLKSVWSDNQHPIKMLMKQQMPSQADILDRIKTKKNTFKIAADTGYRFDNNHTTIHNESIIKKRTVPWCCYSDIVKMMKDKNPVVIDQPLIPVPTKYSTSKAGGISKRAYSSSGKLKVNTDTKNLIEEWHSGRNVRIDDLVAKYSVVEDKEDKDTTIYYENDAQKTEQHKNAAASSSNIKKGVSFQIASKYSTRSKTTLQSASSNRKGVSVPISSKYSKSSIQTRRTYSLDKRNKKTDPLSALNPTIKRLVKRYDTNVDEPKIPYDAINKNLAQRADDNIDLHKIKPLPTYKSSP